MKARFDPRTSRGIQKWSLVGAVAILAMTIGGGTMLSQVVSPARLS